MDTKRTRISPKRSPQPEEQISLTRHHEPRGFRDRVAFGFVKFLRFIADIATPQEFEISISHSRSS